MRIPFPLTLNVGTDIIAYNRLLKPNAPKDRLQRLASRFLHPTELCQLDKRIPNWHTFEALPATQRTRLAVHLAGRWAAKEAAKKAWGATLLSFKDLRIETLSDGQVQVICQSFHGTNASLTHGEADGIHYEQAAKLSISHDGDYAVATVIATPLHADIVRDLKTRKADADSKVACSEVSTAPSGRL